MLAAISEKRYELNCYHGPTYKGVVLHDIWEQVIEPGWTIGFDKVDRPEDPVPEKPTHYDNGVKYSVNFYQKDRHGNTNFLFVASFDEPTEFELDEDRRGDLPVIEERKKLECSSESRPVKPKEGSKSKLKRRPDENVTQMVLHVHSHYLLNVLRSVIQYSTNDDDYFNGVFHYPYKDIFRHRDEIQKYKTENEGTRAKHSADYNAECDKHIDTLLKYLDAQPMIRLPQLKLQWNKTKPMTTFAGVWLLLKPCTDVYVQEDGKLNAFVIDKVNGGVEYAVEVGGTTKISTYRVQAWNLNFDGKIISRRSRWFLVPYFDGEREITSLPLFPVQYHDYSNESATRDRLIGRGKKYFNYCKRPTFLEYTGSGLKAGWKSVSPSTDGLSEC